MSALHARGRAWQVAGRLLRPRCARQGRRRRVTAVTAPMLDELRGELRGAAGRPLCGAVAHLAGQVVFCVRPRHTPDDPEHYGVVWLQVHGPGQRVGDDEPACLGAITWAPARPS